MYFDEINAASVSIKKIFQKRFNCIMESVQIFIFLAKVYKI